MTYKDVIKEYEERRNHIYLSDDYLKDCSTSYTRETAPLVGEYEYGIAYLRDDAVELLINRIKELENGTEK